MDLSHLDKKYFIDVYVYNCPFCKRGNVHYKIVGSLEFDWTEKKKCYGYLVQCQSKGCEKNLSTFKLQRSREELLSRISR